MYYENIFYNQFSGTYFYIKMFIYFYINLVKVDTVWLLEIRELHSFVDVGSTYKPKLRDFIWGPILKICNSNI